MTASERFRFELLAALVHECTLQPLSMWLWEAPAWAEAFVAQLLDDGFAYLFRSGGGDDVVRRVVDAGARLSEREARALLASPAARQAYDVVLAPTDSGAETFSEANPRAMFAYVADSRSKG